MSRAGGSQVTGTFGGDFAAKVVACLQLNLRVDIDTVISTQSTVPHSKERKMRRVSLSVAALTLILAPVTRASAQAEQSRHTIIAVTPEQVRWFTPAYYTDGRQRAK